MSSLGSAIRVLILGVGVGVPAGYTVGLIQGKDRQLKHSREHREQWEETQIYVAKKELYKYGLQVKPNSAGELETVKRPVHEPMPRAEEDKVAVISPPRSTGLIWETSDKPKLFRADSIAELLRHLLTGSAEDWVYKPSSFDKAGGTLVHKNKAVTIMLGGLYSRTAFYVGVDNVIGSLEYEEWEKLRDLANKVQKAHIDNEYRVIRKRALKRLKEGSDAKDK